MIVYDENKFRKTCEEATTMAQASSELGLHFNTFKRHAIKLGCYRPNQGGKGLRKPKRNRIPTSDILMGKYPEFQTYKLKLRLLAEGIFENECSVCDISEWNDNPLDMELDHINGNRTDHRLENLRMICPNCHAQTPTHRARNKSLNREIC